MKRFAGTSVVVLGVVAVFAAMVVSGATASPAKKSAGIQVCGLMPDTKTSVRWEQFDKPALIKAFKAAGIAARVVNAQGDPQKQKTQADQCIADGAKVLIIAPIDSGSAASIEKAYLIPPQSITKANYKLLFTSGFLKKADVCNGTYTQYCK